MLGENKMSSMGLFEAIGGLTFGIAGAYIGYKLGCEAVDYAKIVVENPDI